MPNYYNTGLMYKYLNAPKFTTTTEMERLYKEASDIDEEIKKLRGAPQKWLPLTDETRELQRKASSLYNEFYKISAEINKEYYKYWDTDMSHLIEVIEVDNEP